MGADPLAYVLAQNLHRRHLNESQRSMVAARLETMTHGGDRKGQDQDANLHLDRANAAKKLNVSVRSVAAAKKVQTRANPTIVRRVDHGEVTVTLAAKLATMPQTAQELVAELPERELRLATQRLARGAKEEALAERTLGPPPLRWGANSTPC